jgi:DNA-binding CsgD family transcriptional regulator
VFDARAVGLHALALRLAAAAAAAADVRSDPAARLTRREIRCLKWAAAGKTDAEISAIMRIALPTVRFHINSASCKFKASGRRPAIHRAAMFAYVVGRAYRFRQVAPRRASPKLRARLGAQRGPEGHDHRRRDPARPGASRP